MSEKKSESGFNAQKVIAILLAGAVGGGIIMSVRGMLGAPADQFQYRTPPTLPGAIADPPNPEKLKRLPAGLSPVGGGAPKK